MSYELHGECGKEWPQGTQLPNSMMCTCDLFDIAKQLIDFTAHDRDCILSYYSQGRPTNDGGYEVMYKNKWYQTRPIDQTPKCECGLDDLIARLLHE